MVETQQNGEHFYFKSNYFTSKLQSDDCVQQQEEFTYVYTYIYYIIHIYICMYVQMMLWKWPTK